MASHDYYMTKRESDLRSAFLEQVQLVPDGMKIKQCIQCGTCTGSCPVSFAMEITPRKTIALFRAGEMETILRSNTIWVCASCYACTVRCPAGIKITDTMYAFKRIAMEKKIYPKHFNIHALSTAFIDIVNTFGRNQEVKLLMKFGMKTHPLKLFAQSPLGKRLHSKGRVSIKTSMIRGRKQLSEIIARVLKKQEQHPQS
jgi:heterodisulfide reductase subunit C